MKPAEDEPYLLQLHQTQEELERYFRLHRQKEAEVLELKRQLDRLVQLEQGAGRAAAELLEQREINRRKDRELAELRRQLDALSRGEHGKIGPPAQAQPPAPKFAGIVHRLSRGMFGRSRASKRELDAQAEKIRTSGLFDEAWYLRTYPDVAQAGQDPIEHYLQFGVAEGRNPGPRFDTSWYLQSYPDIGAAGFNPLLHYIEHGKAEGRRPMRGTGMP